MKRILTLLIVCSAAISADAQDLKLYIKAYAGAHAGSNIYKTDGISKENIFGYQGGFAFRIGKGNLIIEPGFNFFRSYVFVPDSIKLEFQELGIMDVGIRYNSFQFPVVAGYRFVNTPLFKWYVAGGFKMNVSLKSQVLDGDEVILSPKAKEFGFRNPRFQMRMGTSMDIAFFNIDIYYNIGLNNAFDNFYRTQTHSVELNFGFLF